MASVFDLYIFNGRTPPGLCYVPKRGLDGPFRTELHGSPGSSDAYHGFLPLIAGESSDSFESRTARYTSGISWLVRQSTIGAFV